MSEHIKLYLVTCVERVQFGPDKKLAVYVLAPEPTIAANRAMQKMKDWHYRYTDWVEDVQLVAAQTYGRAPNMLVD